MVQETRPRVQAETKARIIDVAARLLREEGAEAVTTRGVAQGAGVQAPAIYRLFGDKEGLLEAVAEHVMSTFVSAKAAIVEEAEAHDADPLDDLRAGWEAHIAFGLANPMLFRLLSDPARVQTSAAARSGHRILGSRIHRVAITGRLCVSEERALGIIHAAGVGTVQTILATPPDRRDPGLADAMYEAVLAQILTDSLDRPAPGALSTTVAFRAVALQLDSLSMAERQVLAEWLDRIVASLQAVEDGQSHGGADSPGHP